LKRWQTISLFFTSRATEVILKDFHGEKTQYDPSSIVDGALTSREREIIQLIAEGKSSNKIASCLYVSPKTAETHRANIMRKLKLHSKPELVRYAIRNKIIDQ
jgi:DNA-binding NarL/FixJ family response regulator